MKKFLLSLLIVPLLLIGGFSSAYLESQEYLITCENGSCSKLVLSKWNSYWVIIKSYSCPQLNIFWGMNRQDVYGYYSQGEIVNYNDTISSYSNLTFTILCGLNWNGFVNFVLVSPDPPLVPWTFSNFTPVIDWISDVTIEFIPYVVYIWIWTLLVTLWFIAVKWLVNWLVRKITVIFKSKRG